MASASPGRAGRYNAITDVAAIRVGHHQRRDEGWLTGTTVVVTPPGTVGGVDVRGGGPSTRETDALAPTTLVDVVHAVCLSGGSSYGLAAATGVMDWLGERGTGLPVGPAEGQVVPIVAGACLFDLLGGGDFGHRPDAAFGRAAIEAAAGGQVEEGNAGAGTGAHAGRLKGGIGTASVVLDSGVTVAALVAVNSSGSAVDPATGELYGARHLLEGELEGLRRPDPSDIAAGRELLESPWPRSTRPTPTLPANTLPTKVMPTNTMLAVVATDAALAKHECTRVAMAAHDGMARAVQPAHGMTDGDIVFALATGATALPEAAGGLLRAGGGRPAGLGRVMAAGSETVARAIVRAVVAARGAGVMPAYLDVYPSARA